MSKMPRPAKILLPIIRGHNDLQVNTCTGVLSGDWPELTVVTWNPDVDYRSYPFIEVRRLGGTRHERLPTKLSLAVMEITAYTDVGLPETEQLYEDLLEVLYDAVRLQTQTPDGYLHSIKETLGATQFSSLFQDSWRVQGLIKFGIRPPK
jgi:hypothetical protein